MTGKPRSKARLFVVDKPAEPEPTLEQRIRFMMRQEQGIEGSIYALRELCLAERRKLFQWLADHPDAIDLPGAPRLATPNKPSA